MNCEMKSIVSGLVIFSLLHTEYVIANLIHNISYISNYSVWLQEYHKVVVDKFIRKRERNPFISASNQFLILSVQDNSEKNWTTSVLGDVLFKNKKFPAIDKERQNKTFQVLLWKYWSSFESRFFYRFGSNQVKIDPLRGCSVKNCNFHGNRVLIHEVDAVVVIVSGIKIPTAPMRKPWQRWIFFTDESPPHAVDFRKKYNFLKYSDKFNWSMTYRSDSDIPIPYGRTIPLEKPLPVSTLESLTELIPYWDKKSTNVLMAAMISNCNIKYRLRTIEQLKEYLDVDFYGGCGDETLRMRCPGRFTADCHYLSQYYFYLALENSHCRQYLTEKVFYNSFLKGAIPIIKGPPVADCEKLLPPHSFIHVDNFESIEALAYEIFTISKNIDKLLSYHLWRAHFKVTSESEFFGNPSTSLCRVCEALNYNDLEPSIYTDDDIKLFLDPRIVCVNSELENIKPIILRTVTERMCYKLGNETCIEMK